MNFEEFEQLDSNRTYVPIKQRSSMKILLVLLSENGNRGLFA